jgi:pyruvate dehydrogenase E1 component alpha subunit
MNKQTATQNLASRADGYGFAGVAVDGNNLLAVYASASQAVERALAGGGPTLIECRTYRVGFHNTSDNPKEYRDDAEVNVAIEFDPIERVRRYATRAGWWSAQKEAETQDRFRHEVDDAQRFVEQLPRPGASAIFDHVYESPLPRLVQQRAEVLGINESD